MATRKTNTSKPDVYQIVTERIVAMLEEGTVPWRKPWNSQTGVPRNLDGRPYRGINLMLLGMSGYSSPYWLTFKQAQERGGSVKKGEKGTMIVFWKRIKVTDEVDGKKVDKTIPLLRYFYVFNLDQTEGVKVPRKVEQHLAALSSGEVDHPEPLVEAEAIVAGYADAPEIQYVSGDRAYYTPSTDVITVPPQAQYDDLGEFYSTLFHEIGHSTGHKDRLDRFSGKNHTFGCHDYGREELVAEMTATFLCAEAGIETAFDNSAAYLASWIKTIKEDPKAVVWAAGKAQAAADHVLGRTFEEASKETQEAKTTAA